MTYRYRLFARLGLVEPLVRLQRWANDRAASGGGAKPASRERRAPTGVGKPS